MVKSITSAIIMSLLSLNLYSQSLVTEIKVIDTILVKEAHFDNVIFINKGDFYISFEKSKMLNKLNNMENISISHSPNKKIMQECVSLLMQSKRNVDLEKIKDQFKPIFNDLACMLIEEGDFYLKKGCEKITKIFKVEFFESNNFFGEKTIRFTTENKKKFWTCDLIFTEDYVL